MFRMSAKGGHLSDTPQNRQLLVDMANDKTALLGTDEHGNAWYGRKLPDGTQIWAQVRGNVIINGGLNQMEKTFNPVTGLSAPEVPHGTKSP
jgi:filamentous hemagglutinin